MAVDVSLIRAYTDGLVACTAFQVINGTLPTNATAALDAGFSEIGAISSDGITEATSQDRTDFFIWQGNALARRVPGQATKTFAFAAAETKLFTLGINYPGSTITQTAEGAAISEKPPVTDTRNWVFHGIDGGSRALRIVVPRGEVTERGDVVWSGENVTVYEWTLSAYVDLSGFWAYRYYIDADMASGS
jgi:hypothetical protein